MAKLKWDINGKGAPPKEGGGNNYAGPNLPKNSWPAKVKRLEVTKIASNTVNKGKPRIRILLEVQTRQLDDEGKWQYHGAPVWDGLNIIEGSEGYVNAFLHALTDGSDRQKKSIEAVFWDDDKGPDFKKTRNKKSNEIEVHITKIGRVAINSPNGETMVQITTRPGQDNNGNYRPEVTGYMPYSGPDAEVDADDVDADDDSVDDDDDDLMDDVDDEDEDYEDDVDDVDDDEDEDEKEPVTAGSSKRKPF